MIPLKILKREKKIKNHEFSKTEICLQGNAFSNIKTLKSNQHENHDDDMHGEQNV